MTIEEALKVQKENRSVIGYTIAHGGTIQGLIVTPNESKYLDGGMSRELYDLIENGTEKIEGSATTAYTVLVISKREISDNKDGTVTNAYSTSELPHTLEALRRQK